MIRGGRKLHPHPLLVLKKVYLKAKRSHLVLDNYSLHSGKKVQISSGHFAKNLVLHCLPPYSPRHNQIGKLCKQLHDKITRNHQCWASAQILEKVRRFLARASPLTGSQPSLVKANSTQKSKRRAS